jgi:GPH family glycoside/pentoside/hexuronide:cation symporter
LYLFEYYTRVVGVRPVLVGLAAGLAIAWDAVSDPLMGVICDRTRSRLGRFLPYLLAGGVALPLSLIVLFNPPSLDAELWQFPYLLSAYLFLNTALTIIGVPHLALGSALASESSVRNELYGWRLVFGTFGLLLGVAGPLICARWLGLAADSDAGLGQSRAAASWLLGGVSLLFTGITVAVAWNRSRAITHTPAFTWSSLRSSLGAMARNRYFRPLFLSFFLLSLGRAINGILALPYYKYSLQLPEAQVQQAVLGLFALCIVGSVILWYGLSKRFGKKRPGLVGMLTLGVMTCVAYPSFPEGGLVGPMIAAVVGGIAVGSIMLFESMVTDVADADWLESGETREGLYFGFWRMGQKLSSSVGVFLISLVLEAIGYTEGVAEQTESVERGLAWLYGPGVGVFFLLGALIFMRSPLSFRREREIQEAVRTRRSAQAGNSSASNLSPP